MIAFLIDIDTNDDRIEGGLFLPSKTDVKTIMAAIKLELTEEGPLKLEDEKEVDFQEQKNAWEVEVARGLRSAEEVETSPTEGQEQHRA